MRDDFLIIVDSMANLDLLYYVGNYAGDQELIDKATSHAKTVIKTLVRPDFTTYHVANLDPNNGNTKYHFTHQGYDDNSSWSRYDISNCFALIQELTMCVFAKWTCMGNSGLHANVHVD